MTSEASNVITLKKRTPREALTYATMKIVKLQNDNRTLTAENAKLREALQSVKENMQDTLDLARTGLAPDYFAMTREQWLAHKVDKIAGELSSVLACLQEVLK